MFFFLFFYLNKPGFCFRIFFIVHYIDRILYIVDTSGCITCFLVHYNVKCFKRTFNCISLNMHSSLSRLRTQDLLWLVGPGRAWPWGAKLNQKDPFNGGHWIPPPKRYLANYKLLTKKRSNILPFLKGLENGNSLPFYASSFV